MLTEHMFDTVATMVYEVDVIVQHPLDGQAERSSSRSSSRASTAPADCGSMVPSPAPVDHPCNNTSGMVKGGLLSPWMWYQLRWPSLSFVT